MKSKEIKPDEIKYLDWWDEQLFEKKFYLVILWLRKNGQDASSLHPNSLTDSQIVEICKTVR